MCNVKVFSTFLSFVVFISGLADQFTHKYILYVVKTYLYRYDSVTNVLQNAVIRIVSACKKDHNIDTAHIIMSAIQPNLTPYFNMQTLETKIIEFSNGSKAVVPLILVKLGALSFIAGYLDVHAIHKYGLFVTFQSGNFVIMMNAVRTGDNRLAVKLLIVILCFVIVGGWISMSIIRYHQNWKKAFLPSMINLLLACCLIIVLEVKFPSLFWATFLVQVSVMGCLCHWQSKSGYLTMFHTGNLLKASEFLYKLLNGFTVTQPKYFGDFLTILWMLCNFGAGAGFSASDSVIKALGLIPVIVVCFICIGAELVDPSELLRQLFGPARINSDAFEMTDSKVGRTADEAGASTTATARLASGSENSSSNVV